MHSIPAIRSLFSHRATLTVALVALTVFFGQLAARGDMPPPVDYAIAVDGDVAVVGAPWQDGFTGAAWLLARDGDRWQYVQALRPDDLGRFDHFGAAVAIDGDLIVVGAPWHDRSNGAAYVFRRDGDAWVQQDNLAPDDPAPGARFGHTIAIDRNAIVVGAGGGHAVAEPLAGHRFTRDGARWAKVETVNPPAPALAPDGATVDGIIEALSGHSNAGTRPSLAGLALPDPPDSVRATDGTFEKKVEVRWWGDDLDAVVYRITRGGVLVSVASSDDRMWTDESTLVHPGETYEYCVLVEDMLGQLSDPPECDEGYRKIFAPSRFTASDGDYDTFVKLTWTDLSSVEVRYRIWRNGAPYDSTSANAVMYRDTLADAEAVYEYKVTAVDAAGFQSIAKADSGWMGSILPPVDVSASDGEYLDRIVVTWTDQETVETGFNIYRSDNPTVPITTAAASPGSLKTMTWEDTGIVFGTAYTYCVTTTGTGPVESRRVCDEGRTGLAPPEALSASDSTYDDRVAITWDDVSDFESGYEISRSAGGGSGPAERGGRSKPGPWPTVELSPPPGAVVLDTTRVNATSFNDFTAVAGTTYIYYVRAVNENGGESAAASDIGYRSVVLAPTDVQASDGTFEDYVNVSWKSASTTAVLFKIYRGTTFIKSVNAADRSYRDTGGTAGQEYDYHVVALTALMDEAAGTPDAGRRELLKPTQFTASDDAEEDETILSWTENSRMEAGYLVTRRDTSSAVVDSFFIGPNRSSYTDLSGASGVTYEYTVAAFDSTNGPVGYSAAAKNLGRRTLVAPTDVSATKGESETRVVIRWRDKSEAEDGYKIYRDGSPVAIGTEDDAYEWEDTSPTFGQTHHYEVRAYDPYGESAAGTDSGYTTILAPVSVNGSSHYEDRVELTWVDRSGVEDGFYVYRNDELIATLTQPDVTSYTDVRAMSAAIHYTPGQARGVVISGNYAYVADGDFGLQVIDVSDPANPKLAWSYDTPGDAKRLAVAGNYAYIADGTSLQIVDISNPGDPYVGSLPTTNAVEVAVAGDYAYVVDNNDLLLVVDVTSPVPNVVGSYDGTYACYSVAVDGGYAYLGMQSSVGVDIIDVSTDPANPTKVGNFDAEAWYVRAVTVIDGYAYVGYSSALEIWDVSNPLSAELVGNYPAPDVYGIAVLASTVFVASYSQGLIVLDITDRSAPRLLSSYSGAGGYDVDASGEYAYLACRYNGLHVVLPPALQQGVDYRYCVQAYKGGFGSGSDCGHGMAPSAEMGEIRPMDLNLKLLASTGQANDEFGRSVSISGDRAIVGARSDDDQASAAGAAYAFERDAEGAWVQTQTLHAGDPNSGDYFGCSVSIDGDYAIVGAYYDDEAWSNAGAAYIFERSTDGVWTQKAKLTAGTDAAAEDWFGYSVAISGERAIVGAHQNDDGYTNAGSAYIFARETSGAWSQQAKLVSGEPYEVANFGKSVAISGGRVIVGEPNADNLAPIPPGAAYVFETDGTAWTRVAKLADADFDGPVRLGESVGLDGDWAVVGGTGYTGAVGRTGAVCLFRRSDGGTWTYEQMIVPSGAVKGDNFGCGVGISGDRLTVGAYGETDHGENGGAAYLYALNEAGEWLQIQKVVADDGAAGDYFGYGVALEGDFAVIGAYKDDDTGMDSGSAYVVGVKDVYNLVATDGTLESRVRVTWEDRSFTETGFRVYRDGDNISDLNANVEIYEDFDAEPGRTYEYAVVPLFGARSDEGLRVSDYGWRPANGSITGRISTTTGWAADSVWVGFSPVASRSLLFDGKSAWVDIPDPAGTFGFDAASSFTVEAWVKYQGSAGSGAANAVMIGKATPGGGAAQYPFVLSNRRAAGFPGQLEFKMADGGPGKSVASSRTDLHDNEWHHVACVYDAAAGTIAIHVDSVRSSAPSSGIGDIANDERLAFGAGPSSGSGFNGQLDEVRIWSVARSDSAILATMREPLSGDESGLAGYWPLEACWTPSEEGIRAITDIAAGTHYGTFVGGVYWSEDCAQLDIFPMTDTDGNFVVDRMYYGTNAEFQLRPFLGNHQFDPPLKRVVLTTDSPVENQVNFVDVSTFDVTGTILYAGTGCPAADISILVDSEVAGKTDSKGRFTVAVELGDHSIRASYTGHTFSDSLELYVDEDQSVNGADGVAFYDSTTFVLSGGLGGGCGRYVGDITVTARSENDCMLWESTYGYGDTLYTVELPPQGYLVSASVDPQTIPGELSKVDVIRFFQDLGVRLAELDSTDVAMDFVYRAPLQIAITGFEEYIDTECSELTFDDRVLPAGLPVVPQFTDRRITAVPLLIRVNEMYGTCDTCICELDSGTVMIYDELIGGQNAPYPVPVIDGVAACTTYAVAPSLIVGRTDENGNDRSFQKAIRAVVDLEGRDPVSATQWVLITGHIAAEGADFVTGIVEPPSYILRDPPGDNSFVFLEKGHEWRKRIEWDNDIVAWQAGFETEIKWGVDWDFFIGLGGGVEKEGEVKYVLKTDWMFGNTHFEEWKTDMNYKVTRTFSTSSNDPFIGGDGDVYIGEGFNFIFSEVGVVDVEDCVIGKAVAIGFQPDSIATVYAYTDQYIRDVLIPELDSKAAHYHGLGDDESAVGFEAKAARWRAERAENARLKAEAGEYENRSFSAGADFTYYYQRGRTESYSHTETFVMDGKLSPFGVDVKPGVGADYVFKINTSVHHENIGAYDDSSGTQSTAVGYTLSDDDIGDHFTVNIAKDGRYPTPVFDVLAGVSSCPYEPWAVADTARMTPRDKPVMFIDPPERKGVPADEPAVFTLTLANESPTGEPRLYRLRLLTTSNPHGAVVKAGGSLITGGVDYFIETEPSQEVTLTVERGPRKYNYNGYEGDEFKENLAVIFYPPCEYTLWEDGGPLQRADTVWFNVEFDAPCSDIAMIVEDPFEQNGWVFDRDDEDNNRTINLLLTDYEWQISEDDTLVSVGAEYRRLGSGREGPGPWVNITDVTNPGDESTEIVWTPSPQLEDGVYEVRAYTNCGCLTCRGYSAVSTGTIERNGPVVFGSPEPADGELSLGEDIRITFNELIECRSILPGNVILTYLDGPDSTTTIPVETECNEKTIVIVPQDPPDKMEGRRIEASVTGITDRAGNVMAGAKTWQFVYRKSLFTWSQLHLAADVAYRDPGTITATLANGTDAAVDFDVSTLPSWITAATPQTGTLLPGTTQEIALTLQSDPDPDLAIGLYEGEVRAVQTGGGTLVAVMNAHVTVSCREPQWVIDPGAFEHTMTMVAELDIDDTLSTDADDMVAAYVGNQLRGVAHVMYVGGIVDQYLAFLTVYSNRVAGETVRFRIWDDSNCRLYNAAGESFPFEANTGVGRADSCVTLTATDVEGAGALTIAVNEGWTWVSTNIAGDMSVNAVLADLTPADGDIIKSQTAFSQAVFQPDTLLGGWTWEGTLGNLDNRESYMLRLSTPGAIVHAGSPAASSTPVPVKKGWNWIGYVPAGPIDVTTALADLDSCDVIKSQTAFAECVGGVWYGSLDSMRTGHGYKLHRTGATSRSFVYPVYSGSLSPPAAVAAGGTPVAEPVANAPVWSVNPYAYQYNMTVTAVLNIEGRESSDGRDMVGAFVGGECRGVAQPVYVGGTGRYVAFLMIHSNAASGETVTFRAFDADAGVVYDVRETVAWTADAVAGTVQQPVVLNASENAGDGGVPAAFGLAQNVPNPFNPTTVIGYDVPGAGGRVTIRIYDVTGRLVHTLVDRAETPGRKAVTWEGYNDNGQRVATGVYFYRMTAPGFSRTLKMVLLK